MHRYGLSLGMTVALGAVAISQPALAQSFVRKAEASLTSALVYRGIQEQGASITLKGGVELGPVEISLRSDAALQERDAVADRAQLAINWEPLGRLGAFTPQLGLTHYETYNEPAPGPFVQRGTELRAGLLIDSILAPRLHFHYDLTEEIATVEAGFFQSIELAGPSHLLDLSLDIGHVEPDQADGFQYLVARAEYVRLFTQGWESFGALEGVMSSEDTLISDFQNDQPVYGESGAVIAQIGLRRTF